MFEHIMDKEIQIMDNNQFKFRRYMESDLDIIYEEFMSYCWQNIQPYFSGTGIGMEKYEFEKKIQKLSYMQHRPPIIANAKNVPCGIYQITYHHANRYHELMLHFWEEKDFTKSILEEIINQALHKELPKGSLLLKVPGYAPELIQAAEDLGLDLVGTIPNYLCHDDELHHRYYYVITSEQWYSAKD